MARKLPKRTQALNSVEKSVECTALYIRVSTEKQADEGFSLDSQKERLQAFCVAHGWTVDERHVYVDAGISGKTTDRAAFQSMMQAARDGVISRIVVMKLDRLARNVKDFLSIADELKGVGCDLVLVKEAFDTSTAQGKFAITLFAAIAELEASTITERVLSGKAQKAKNGGYNGARCPLGYEYANGAFTVIAAHAETVRTVFDSFVAGETLLGIAEKMNKARVTTARSGTWYASTVRAIVTNGFYAGLAQWKEEEVLGKHPAIISLDLYEQAIKRFDNIKRGPVAGGDDR